MNIIPLALKREIFRFVLLKKRDKVPVNKNWTDSSLTYNSLDLLDWVKKGNNYGVIGGYGNLIILDFDNQQIQDRVVPLLPKTFTVQTGTGKMHKYFHCDDPKSFKVMDSSKNTLVDVQGTGKQVVGAGSLHPNGKRYVVIDKSPIAVIKIKQLQILFADYLKPKDQYKEEYAADDLTKEIKSRIGIKELMDNYGYDTSKNPTMCKLGHGSKGGKCFSWSESKNLWNCFHCDEGGDVFSFIQKHDSSDFVAAKDKLMSKVNLNPNKDVIVVDKEEEVKIIEFIDYKTLMDMKDERKFLIDNFLPERSVIMFVSPPEQYKSLIASQMSLCIATGNEFLDFKVQKAPVLLCDMENGFIELRRRLNMLKKGLEIDEDKLPIYFTESSIDLKHKPYRQELFNFVESKKIKLVIFDTLSRFASIDQNSANDVNELYIKVFKPLKQMGVSVLFLHHTQKNSWEYRGSGDFLGNVDVAYTIKKKDRHGTKFEIQNTKNRFGMQQKEKIFGFVSMNGEERTDIEVDEGLDIKQQKSDIARSFIIDSLNKDINNVSEIYENVIITHSEISRKTIQREMIKLVDEGKVQKEGSTNKVKYKIIFKEEEVE